MKIHSTTYILQDNQHSKGQNPFKSKQGFTLIEILIAVAILGLLSSLAFIQYNKIKLKGYHAAASFDVRVAMTHIISQF